MLTQLYQPHRFHPALPAPQLYHQLQYSHASYPDHHNFSESDIATFVKKAGNKLILTTEKDFMRLQGRLDNLYYLPIAVAFLAEEAVFQKIIKGFLETKDI